MKNWKLIPAVILLSSAALAGEEKRFVPEKCFPLECMAYLRVPSGKSLLLALRDTLIGRVATDPEVRQALGSLPQIARALLLQNTGPVVEITGRDPLELAGLFQNEAAVSITGLDPRTGLSVLVAIEMGNRRREILEVVGKISDFFSRAMGRDLEEVELEGRMAVAWPIFGGLSALYHLRLGTHIVFASSREVLRDVAKAHDGGVESGFTLASNPRYMECKKALALESPRLTAFANLEAIRGLVMMFLLQAGGGGEAEELMKALNSSGLMSITTLGYSLGSRGGDVEGKMLLGTGDGARGLLGDLLGAFSPPEGMAAALSLIPAEANEAGALGVDAGKIFRAIHGFLRQGLPGDLSRQVDGMIQEMEKRSGLSLERDLFSLGRIDLYTFTVTPPAGGLIPDGLTLVRTEQFRPYREVIEKIAGALKRKPGILDGPGGAGKRITYLSAGSVFTRLLGMKTPPPPEGLLHAVLQPPISLASTELDGGWTLLSNSPQAIWRYLVRGGGSRSLSTVAGVDRRIREDLEGARALVIFRGGTSFLPIYNSLIEMASIVPVEYLMGIQGIDLARLPPGEKFLEYIKDGFLRIDAGPRGITVHGHRVLSSGSSGLWALPILGLISAVPYLALEEAAPAPKIEIPQGVREF